MMNGNAGDNGASRAIMLETHVLTHDVIMANDENLYIVMPYCSGDLCQRVAMSEEERLTEDESRRWFLQILMVSSSSFDVYMLALHAYNIPNGVSRGSSSWCIHDQQTIMVKINIHCNSSYRRGLKPYNACVCVIETYHRKMSSYWTIHRSLLILECVYEYHIQKME